MATIVEKRMTELSDLVEELQNEIDTFDTAQHSLIHTRLISDLTAAVAAQALLLRRSVLSTTSSYPRRHTWTFSR